MTRKNNPSFKGRKSERAQLLNFIKENKKGYFCLLGHPGIGKSALMAEFIKDVSQHYELEKVATIAYWIRRGTAQAQVDYFLNDLIKKTDDIFPQAKEIKSEGKTFFDLQYQLLSKWRLLGELKSDTKLIVFIDGLDEGADNDIVDYLPNQLFENVLLVYSSRPGGNAHLEEFWTSLPIENQVKIDLGGLAEVDIRDLLDEVTQTFEQKVEDSWVSEVVRASKGNPLYIKLMCDSIEKGLITVNQSNLLPNELNDYYKVILQRFSSYHNGESLLKCIYSMAAAKDFLTLQHLGFINKLDVDFEHQVGTLVKEVCYESVLDEGVIGYQLFHESLREYLAKEQAALVAEANIEIIHFCSNWRELNGKWEQRYTLEHYARHLSESGQKEHQSELLTLFQNNDYAATQKSVLRHFDATKHLFQHSLETSIALKNPDLQLEAALHLVDLKNEEAADAPQVVAMVANNEIELALKRIESFAGSDADGVKRKFQLYMLCLMELTLMDSKNKPFRKEAIEKLLNHLDAHLPVDTNLLNWDNFFPGNLVFKMASEWAALGLDFMRVYKRALRDYHDEEQYLDREGPFSDIQFGVLMNVCRIDFIVSHLIKQQKFQKAIEFVLSQNDDFLFNSQRKLRDISLEIAKQGKFDKALECVSFINEESEKSSVLKKISIELAKQGKIDKAIEVAKTISNETFIVSALTAIITEMVQLSLLQEALTCARGISDDFWRSIALKDISTELAKQGKVAEDDAAMQEALACARGISDDYWKSNALKNISTVLAKQGKVAEADAAMQEALTCAGGIPDDHPFEAAKSIALMNISTELAKQGKVKEAHTYARDITDVRCKSSALQIISSELAKQGRTEEAKTLLIKALKDIAAMIEEVNAKKNNEQSDTEESNSVDDDHLYEDDYYENEIDFESDTDTEERIIHLKNQLYEEYDEKAIPSELENTLNHIYKELVIQGIDTEAFDFILEFGDINYKIRAYIHLATENVKVNEIEKADELIDRFIGTLTKYANYEDLHYARKSTTLAFIELDKFEDAKIQMEETLRNSVEDERCNDCTWWCFEEFIPALEKKEKLLIGADWVNSLHDDWVKDKFFGEISLKLVHKGHVNEALKVANEISNNIEKIKILASICSELYFQDQPLQAEPVMQRALDLFHIIDGRKDAAMKSLSAELFYQGKWSKCNELLLDSITSTMIIPEVDYKNNVLNDLFTELAKQGKIEEAHICAKEISVDWRKCRALKDIALELAKLGKVEETITCAREIPNDSDQSSTLKDISIEMARQGKVEEALSCARGIPDVSDQSRTLKDISTELAKQGKVEEAASAMQEALTCARGISDESDKSSTLKDISTELVRQGKLEEALTCARGISSDFWKSLALKDISTELAKQGKVEEALTCARGISDESDKSSALKDISTELGIQGKVEEAASAIQEALTCARGISDDSDQSSALKDISTELAKQGKVEEAASALQEALTCARGISDDFWKNEALKGISIELARQGKVEEALSCAKGVSYVSAMSDKRDDIAFEHVNIAIELVKLGKVEAALTCVSGISDDYWKSNALQHISTELAKQGKVQEAITCARGIPDVSDKSSALKNISGELAKQGKIEEALSCARGIPDVSDQSRTLKDISTELAKQGKVEEAASAMQEALTCAREINSDQIRDNALKVISVELARQGKIEDAEEVGRTIGSRNERQKLWQVIAGIPLRNYDLQLILSFKQEESRFELLKVLASNVNILKVDWSYTEALLRHLVHDSDSIEKLLTKHAIHSLFLTDVSEELILRMNKTLNIQWAINIRNQVN